MRQLIESMADPREFLIVAAYVANIGGQGRKFEPATALDGESISYMIDDESPHDSRGISHESAAIGKGLALLCGHIKVSLMDERGSTDAHLTLTRELAFGQPVQFTIKKSEQLTGGSFVAMFRQVDE